MCVWGSLCNAALRPRDGLILSFHGERDDEHGLASQPGGINQRDGAVLCAETTGAQVINWNLIEIW